MSAMEATVVATAMPTVVADLHGIELYGWVGSIYMLASTVTIPLWGAMSDRRGRRPAMLAGMAFFLAGSLMSGAARTMPMLVLGRAVQGVGAGSLQPVPLTIIGDLYSVEERGRVQGYFSAIWGLSGMAGPLVGGLIVRALSWRWVFYVNVPFGLFSAAMLVAFFHEHVDRSRGERPVDLAGAAALTACVLSLLLGVGGTRPFLTLPFAAASLAAFIAVERRAPEPIVPLVLFARRLIAVASVAGALMGTVMMSTLMFLPLYMQAARGASPTEAGATVAPMLVGWPLASLASGRMLTTVGPRALVRTGLAMVCLGTTASWLLVRGDGSARALQGAMFAFGLGMGLANTALLVAVQESVSRAQRGIATASSLFSRSIGGAVSVGALGALVARRLEGAVDDAQLNALLGPEHGRGLDPRAVASMAGAVAHGMLPLFAVIAAAGVLTAMAGLAFPAMRLGGRVSTPPPME